MSEHLWFAAIWVAMPVRAECVWRWGAERHRTTRAVDLKLALRIEYILHNHNYCMIHVYKPLCTCAAQSVVVLMCCVNEESILSPASRTPIAASGGCFNDCPVPLRHNDTCYSLFSAFTTLYISGTPCSVWRLCWHSTFIITWLCMDNPCTCVYILHDLDLHVLK